MWMCDTWSRLRHGACYGPSTGSQPQLGTFLKFAEQYKLLLWQRQKRFTTHRCLPDVICGDSGRCDDFDWSRLWMLDSEFTILDSEFNSVWIQWARELKLDDYLCWFWSCPNGNLNRIFNPAAICILEDVTRIKVEYNSLIVAAIWKREICLGLKRLDGLTVVPLLRPWWLYDSERIGCKYTYNGFEWIHVIWRKLNSSGFTLFGVRRIWLNSRRLESDEFEWIHVDWAQMNSSGFALFRVSYIRVDSYWYKFSGFVKLNLLNSWDLNSVDS